MPRHTLGGLALFVMLLSALAVGAPAQVVSTGARGWIGVSFEAETRQTGSGVTVSNRITDVLPGSPAEQAGLRPGDVLVSVNGRDWREELGRITQSLRPGEVVRFVVERDGRRRDVRVTAGSRATMESVSLPSWTFTVTADSMAEYLYQAMDSLRVRIVEGDGRGFRIATQTPVSGDSTTWRFWPGEGVAYRVPRVDAGRIGASPLEGRVADMSTGAPLPEVRPPFGFYLFRGQAHDSLRAEMESLNREIRTLGSRQTARLQELARGVRAGGRIDENDPELRGVEERFALLGPRADRLRAAMDEAAHRQARDETGGALARPSVGTSTEVDMVLRPLAPYVLGQNRAAGAEVVDLRPELAAYFEVDGGVLVVDVPAGTPAEAAGIQPGDVLIRVDDLDVRSIADLRRGLSRAVPELQLTVVRKGRTLRVPLRR